MTEAITEAQVRALYMKWIEAHELYHDTDEESPEYAEIADVNRITYEAYQTARKAYGIQCAAELSVFIGQVRQFDEPMISPDTVQSIAYDAAHDCVNVYFKNSWARWDLEDVALETKVFVPVEIPPTDLSDIPF